MGSKILVIESDPSIQKILRTTLTTNGFSINEMSLGSEAIQRISQFRPALIVLGVELPDVNCIRLLSEIRQWSTVPIIILSTCNDEDVKVSMLDHGADDYVVKPFGTKELVARIRVGLRRSLYPVEDPVLNFGPITIDLTYRSVMRNEEPVCLTPTEYEILKVLAVHAGRVLTHRQITQQVWSEDPYDKTDQYLRIYVGRLRKKLENDPSHPKIITTELGVGYRLMESP